MKTKTVIITLIGMLVITTLVFQSCKKDEVTKNKSPTCEITAPNNGQEFAKGESITISAEANDSDGKITEVRFAIDGIGKAAANSYPYNYNWLTSNESLGSHIIKVTSIDNGGGSASDEITVVLTENGVEISTFTDPRDGQTYQTVEIGSQTWMAENLNYETTNSWWYDNSSANGDIYGRLYTWDAALIACPGGWHLPSDDEWKTLEMTLGMSQSEADDIGWRGTDEGEKMKSTSGWNSNGNGTNSSGFNGLSGGNRYNSGSFSSLGDYGYWWSSAELSGTLAWHRGLDSSSGQVGRGSDYKTFGFSVRCLKN